MMLSLYYNSAQWKKNVKLVIMKIDCGQCVSLTALASSQLDSTNACPRGLPQILLATLRLVQTTFHNAFYGKEVFFLQQDC